MARVIRTNGRNGVGTKNALYSNNKMTDRCSVFTPHIHTSPLQLSTTRWSCMHTTHVSDSFRRPASDNDIVFKQMKLDV